MKINYSQEELQKLNEIKNYLKKTKENILCVSYDQFDRFRWNVEKNRYGNFFKMRIDYYPNCPKPIMSITT